MRSEAMFFDGDLFDGGEGLADAGVGGALVVDADDEAGEGVGRRDGSTFDTGHDDTGREWSGVVATFGDVGIGGASTEDERDDDGDGGEPGEVVMPVGFEVSD